MAAVSPDSIQLQDRDVSILRGLFESRVMTAAHISNLYFDGRPEAAKKRLQKLKAAGFVTERSKRVNEASILFLTRKAFQALHDRGALSGFPPLTPSAFERRSRVSSLTLHHELEVMDTKAAFHAAIRETGHLLLVEFITWPLLCQFQAHPRNGDGETILVKPDGYVRVHERERDGGVSEHAFFLEVDRSSETQDTLVSRAGCYLDYYASGGYAVRHGGTRENVSSYPFRVLMVFKSEERRNNTAERLLQLSPPILTQVWLSTLAEVTTNPLGDIWIRPLDYREVTNDTPFDPDARRHARGYHREREREAFVASRIKKSRLFE